MNITNLARLIGGEILTKPQVVNVENFALDIAHVGLASAFLSQNASSEELKKAYELGAYAIIFEGECEICSDEIAYIKVKSINFAILALIRYFSNLNDLKFIKITSLQYELIKTTNLSRFVTVLSDDKNENFYKILKASPKSFIMYENAQTIAIKYEILEKSENYELLNNSQFISSFVFMDKIYRNLNISPFFLDEICKILSFCEREKIDIKFQNFKDFPHFIAIFVNKNFEILPFGGSEIALIIEPNAQIFDEISKYLQDKNDILILDKNANLDEFFAKTPDFRYALINANYDEILEILDRDKPSFSLFG